LNCISIFEENNLIMHELFNSGEHFQPSKEAKLSWRRTRKLKKEIKGSNDINIIHTGLYHTINFNVDRLLFRLGLFFESIGILAIIWAAGEFNLILFGGFFAAVFIDVILAIISHYKHGEICELRLKKSIEEYNLEAMRLYRANNQNDNVAEAQIDAKREEIIDLDKKIGKRRWASFVGSFFIILVAMSKIYFFIETSIIFNSISVAIILIYLFVAYVHIFHTGYFLAERNFRKNIIKEKKAFNIRLNKLGGAFDINQHNIRYEKSGEFTIFPYALDCFNNVKELRVGKNQIWPTKINGMTSCVQYNLWPIVHDQDLYLLSESNPCIAAQLMNMQISWLSIDPPSDVTKN
jgi:hypothetical protein